MSRGQDGPGPDGDLRLGLGHDGDGVLGRDVERVRDGRAGDEVTVDVDVEPEPVADGHDLQLVGDRVRVGCRRQVVDVDPLFDRVVPPFGESDVRQGDAVAKDLVGIAREASDVIVLRVGELALVRPVVAVRRLRDLVEPIETTRLTIVAEHQVEMVIGIGDDVRQRE